VFSFPNKNLFVAMPGGILIHGSLFIVSFSYTWRGTHRGEFQGISPTGKQVMVTGISIYRTAGGKIAEEWWQEDMLGLMQQLGVITELPLVSLTLELGRHFHFRLETVTMVRYDLSKVVTDQKHDEQFFHEGSHV
jgi:hypothetical protein